MKFRCMTRGILAMCAFAVVALAGSSAVAQETGDRWPRWWYGIYGGANINMFSGEIHSLGSDTLVAAPTGFDAGSGLGLALGGILEFNSGGLLGGNLMIGYDNKSIAFDAKNATASPVTERSNETLEAHLAYLTVEPNVRINLGSKLFHLTIGPSFRILLNKTYDYSFTTGTQTTPVAAEFTNIRSFVAGGQAGLGYDIPLTSASASTQIVLTPFAQFHITQDLLDVPEGNNDKFSVNTVRAGLQLKFGSAGAAPGGGDAPVTSTEFSVRTPSVITESRKLNETFPLRNYIFFDAGSTDIPSRYKTVTSGDNFREEQLIKPSAETGGADAMHIRSRRQMEVYYNVMNVFGDRLRRNPSATIKLTGSANGDAATGKQMAENVKSYMVRTFNIDGNRITTEGTAMPRHRSGSGSSQGEDKKMIDAENYRVEIEGTPADIMQPVMISSVQEEPLDNDIIVSVPQRDDMAFWTVEIAERGGASQTFGPYRNTTTARIESEQLLGGKRDARYTAKVIVTTRLNSVIESEENEFRLVRADADEEQTGTRFSTLFEFDESKTVQTYEQFLAQTVAPGIPNGSSVIIHGHTDGVGDPDYNQKLSQRRSEETQRVLTRELTKLGRTVTFDTYGFGEDERRSPFNNTLPEQRYYNRTVVIEVVPGR